jgi:hypothetical protein
VTQAKVKWPQNMVRSSVWPRDRQLYSITYTDHGSWWSARITRPPNSVVDVLRASTIDDLYLLVLVSQNVRAETLGKPSASLHGMTDGGWERLSTIAKEHDWLDVTPVLSSSPLITLSDLL